MSQQWMTEGHRFLRKDVKPGARDLADIECREQSLVIDDAAASGIDEGGRASWPRVPQSR